MAFQSFTFGRKAPSEVKTSGQGGNPAEPAAGRRTVSFINNRSLLSWNDDHTTTRSRSWHS
jgi:hypothetical protein